MTKNIYSVSQVNNYIKNMFAEDFLLRNTCVKGEVSNCKYHSSGHIYFTLKDEGGTINAIMFAGNRRNGLNFPMKEGDKVIVTGSIEIYERDGKYQIYARTIELDGEGNLYLKFEALKKNLEEMGMFASEYKRPIPKYVKKVGIVTAPTGAAIQDIRNIATRRNPYVQLILYPALVQGEGAADSIVKGIAALEQTDVDVIIVGRGGGSIEDLWAFNEEKVAYAIFHCSVPVISAVGHETDWTIADYVSDLRAPTPSAAAELAVFDYVLTKQSLTAYVSRMGRSLKRSIFMARERLEYKKAKLMMVSPKNRLNENRKALMDMEDKLSERMKMVFTLKKHELVVLAKTLEGMSPAKKLSSGYAYVENENGQSVKSASALKPRDEIMVHVTDGKLKAVITEVYLNE